MCVAFSTGCDYESASVALRGERWNKEYSAGYGDSTVSMLARMLVRTIEHTTRYVWLPKLELTGVADW